MLLPKPPRTVFDLSVAQLSISFAVTNGLLRDPGANVPDESYEHAFELTDAGRFHLRTAVTGPRAHAILDEIAAEEMAGQA